jgi:hypothetical protein
VSEDKHDHGKVHFAWAIGGNGERVHYRLEAEGRFGPTRELTVQQAESYMLVPNKDYTPKDGTLDMQKWTAYLKRLCDSVMRLEKDKPGTIVYRPEKP